MRTLSDLCLEVIAGNIEKYPPHCFSSIAESEWEEIVRKKYRSTSPGQNMGDGASPAITISHNAAIGPTAVKVAAPVILSGGLDGKGRTVPALAGKIIREIEDANPHLAKSAVADNLVWKDCVEYKFKSGSISRPRAFQYPWPILVERVKTSGEDLLSLLQPPPCCEEERRGCSEATVRRNREEKMMKSVQTLGDSIMNLPLLSASGVGKSVKKFVKECKKLVAAKDGGHSFPRYMPDVTSARPNLRLLSPLQYLENLLNGWKAVASSSGVVLSGNIDKTSTCSAEQFSGRNKKTSEDQHTEDIAVVSECLQWRDLHIALTNREAAQIAHHGEKMRKLREDLDLGRPKIGKVGTAHRSVNAARTQNRHEAILSKSRGTRAKMAASAKPSSSSSRSGAGASGCKSRIQALRQEVAFKRSRQVAVGTGGPRSTVAPPMRSAATAQGKMSFGASVAAHASNRPVGASNFPSRPMKLEKRKGIVGSVSAREVELSGGRRMALPNKAIGSRSSGAGIFSAIAEKKRKAAASEAYMAKRRRENDFTPRFKK
mmetsp:Transcript_30444/g.65853  ORF Transcript_30444/g.65853 Transcript_30444/m.65853 type:complete len:545 (+) Transcript_30444:232-1866(+)